MNIYDKVDTAWNVLLIALAGVSAVLLLAMLTAFVCADRRVEFYYLQHSLDRGRTCVKQSVQWDEDRYVYCSEDPEKSLAVMERANSALPKAVSK